MVRKQSRDFHHSKAGDDFRQCLEKLRSSEASECFKLLPAMAIQKDKRLLPTLREMLFCGQMRREEVAVCCLAAIGAAESLPWLFEKARQVGQSGGAGSQRMQTAILDAIGEIGDDAAIPGLMGLFDFHLERDNFRRKRRAIIVDVLGLIAQQDGQTALKELVRLLGHPDFMIRAQACTAIATAFWQRPNEMSPEIFERLLSLFQDSNLFVQHSLISALETLANVGSEKAAALFAD